MKNLTLTNIANACKGKLNNISVEDRSEVTDVVIDSRKVSPGCLFIAVKGARVDGHDFIPQVMKAGAMCAVSEVELDTNEPYILVESTLQALMDIAAFYRRSLKIKVVGITGSVGKTSTKEMISSVLSEKYKVLKTEGNFNNEIGLPLTIFRLREEHQIAVLEMGISHFGDMTTLAKIAQPDISVITNIGICHLENLIDRDGVLKAKTEMFAFLPENGCIILNGDDDKLNTINSYNDINPVFYGINSKTQVHGSGIAALGLKGSFFTLNIAGEKVDVYIKVPGYHMVYNALAAAAVGNAMGLSIDEIKHGIENMETVTGRINVIETEYYTIIDDCYNANPISVKAALDVLYYGKGRKVAILGDMFELGENENDMHATVGKYAAEKGTDLLICIGELSKYTAKAASENGMASSKIYHFNTKEDFLEEMNDILHRGDNILVKASHGMEFPKIVERIKKK